MIALQFCTKINYHVALQSGSEKYPNWQYIAVENASATLEYKNSALGSTK
jgi:hypothetical protein